MEKEWKILILSNNIENEVKSVIQLKYKFFFFQLNVCGICVSKCVSMLLWYDSNIVVSF